MVINNTHVFFYVHPQDESDDEGQPNWRVSRVARQNRTNRGREHARACCSSGSTTLGSDGRNESECTLGMVQELQNNKMMSIEDPKDGNEESISMTNGCWGERDNESTQSQDDLCSEDLFAIDLEEIAAGRAARMPGEWECIPVEEDPTTATQDLLTALRIKAEAFANSEWQSYWSLHGPSVLATTWTNQYPRIPLQHIEALTGIDFLCQAFGEKITQDLERCTLNGEDDQEAMEQTPLANFSSSGSDLTNAALIVKPCTDSLVTSGLNGCGSHSEDSSTEDTVKIVESQEDPVGDLDVHDVPDKQEVMANADGGHSELNLDGDKLLSVWDEFYNSIYWFLYHCFTGSQQQGEEEKADMENVPGESASDVDSHASQQDEESLEVEYDHLRREVDRLSIEPSPENGGNVAADNDSWKLSGENFAACSSPEEICMDAKCSSVTDECDLSQQFPDQSQSPTSCVGSRSIEEVDDTNQPMINWRRHQSRYEIRHHFCMYIRVCHTDA